MSFIRALSGFLLSVTQAPSIIDIKSLIAMNNMGQQHWWWQEGERGWAHLVGTIKKVLGMDIFHILV